MGDQVSARAIAQGPAMAAPWIFRRSRQNADIPRNPAKIPAKTPAARPCGTAKIRSAKFARRWSGKSGQNSGPGMFLTKVKIRLRKPQ